MDAGTEFEPKSAILPNQMTLQLLDERLKLNLDMKLAKAD